MSFHKTYSGRNVEINYAGKTLNEGRPEDVFATISQGSPRASFRKGIDGNTSAALSSDHSVTVTLSFFPESDTAKLLASVYFGLKDAEKAGNVVLGAVPLTILEPSGSVFMACPEAVMVSMGDNSLGGDTGTIDFEFYVEDAYQATLPSEVSEKVKEALADLGV